MSKEGRLVTVCVFVCACAHLFFPFVGINKLVTRNQRWSRSDFSLWCSCSRTFCSVRWKPYVIHYLFLLKLPFFTVFNLRLYYKYQAHNQCTLFWAGLALGHKMSVIILFTEFYKYIKLCRYTGCICCIKGFHFQQDPLLSPDL